MLSIGRWTLDVESSTETMTNDLSAEKVRALLQLEPHTTCGFVRVTFIGNQRIAPGVEKVDVEIGDVEAMATKYPDVANDLLAFQKG
jgi:hypothetical protein